MKFDAGSLVYTENIEDRIISIEKLRRLKGFSDAKTLVKFMHRKIVFIKVESRIIELSKRVQVFLFLKQYKKSTSLYIR